MTLKGGIVASVHTTVIFQAFNGIEQFFEGIPKRGEGGGLVVPRTESMHIYTR